MDKLIITDFTMDTSNYFYRNVIFSKQGDQIALIDINNPKNEGQVLEPWLGLVLQLANGQHTIDELYYYLADKYIDARPENLDKTINSIIDRLVNLNFVVLTKEPTELPYYLSQPIELLDVEKAKRLLGQDQRKHNKS